MSDTSPDGSIDRLHRDLGLKRLNPAWAKLEIWLGLVAAVVGLIGAMRLAAVEARTGESPFWLAWAGQAVLMVLGIYLALAGHRSHLYQSNNRLAAHLADNIRKNSTNPPQPEKAS